MSCSSNDTETRAASADIFVKQGFDDGSQLYGSGKMHIVLANTGIHINKKIISAIINKLNLKSFGSIPRKNTKIAGRSALLYCDIREIFVSEFFQ